MDWHARGARRTEGKLAMHHVKKLLATVNDLQPHEKTQFSSVYSPLALAPREYEEWLEQNLGGKLPCENYTKINFDPKYHMFANDIDKEYFRKADMAPRTGDFCNVMG